MLFVGRLRPAGASALGDALYAGAALHTLLLSKNALGDAGVAALAEAIENGVP